MKKIKKRVDLSEGNLTWLATHYPNASLSGTLEMLLTKFRELHSLSPVELAEIGAREILKLEQKVDLSGMKSIRQVGNK